MGGWSVARSDSLSWLWKPGPGFQMDGNPLHSEPCVGLVEIAMTACHTRTAVWRCDRSGMPKRLSALSVGLTQLGPIKGYVT